MAQPALGPERFTGSIEASRDTLDKPRMKLIEIVAKVRELTGDAPYAVVGGLAQILWARKSHTDDLDVALAAAAADLAGAFAAVRGRADAHWSLPADPDVARESNEVFEVCHLLHDGAVVDLLAFRNEPFNAEVLATAQSVPELGGIRFIRPELLLVTQLLRPGPTGALAAVELVIARRAAGGLDIDYARRWAAAVDRAERFEHVMKQAAVFDII